MHKENCQELFTLTIEQFARTIEMGISLESLFVIECILQGTDPAMHLKGPKLAGIKQLLTRKNFLEDGKITAIGKAIYEDLRCGGMAKEAIEEVKKESLDSFEVWWTIFPAHDGFEIKGRKFDRTRALRTGKEVCRTIFQKNVISGPYTADQIIEATKAHIVTVRYDSAKNRKNGLTYINNSQTYLRNKVYEAFMDAPTPKEPAKEQVNNTTIDI